MIRSPEMLREVDERYERERLADLTYHEALERFHRVVGSRPYDGRP